MEPRWGPSSPSRDIMAGYFNQTWKKVFPLPEARLDRAPVVPGTDGKKMSKSYGNTIDIFAEGAELKSSVMRVVTDSTPVADPKDPDKDNVFALYSLFASPEERDALARRYRAGGLGYGDAKKMLIAKIDEAFASARERRRDLEKDPARVEAVLRRGAEKANAVANATMRRQTRFAEIAISARSHSKSARSSGVARASTATAARRTSSASSRSSAATPRDTTETSREKGSAGTSTTTKPSSAMWRRSRTTEGSTGSVRES